MNFKCNCHNSGTNCFTLKCDRCGMTKPSQGIIISNNSSPYKTVHDNKNDLEQFYSTQKEYNYQNFEYKEEDYINKIIYNLDRFTHIKNGMLEDLNGDYVLFSDILEAISKLFSAKKK